MDQDSLKKLGAIVLISALIFWAFKPKKDGRDKLFHFSGGGGKDKKSFISKPELSDEQMNEPTLRLAYEALCAYIDAANEGKSESELQSIKQEMSDQMGIVIYNDASGKLAVKDTAGNDILVNS